MQLDVMLSVVGIDFDGYIQVSNVSCIDIGDHSSLVHRHPKTVHSLKRTDRGEYGFPIVDKQEVARTTAATPVILLESREEDLRCFTESGRYPCCGGVPYSNLPVKGGVHLK